MVVDCVNTGSNFQKKWLDQGNLRLIFKGIFNLFPPSKKCVHQYLNFSNVSNLQTLENLNIQNSKNFVEEQ